MYEYKFVKVEITISDGQPKGDYEELVHTYAKQGWRLKQIVTPPFSNNGQTAYLDIIFERRA
ncbi:hypothetical protein J2S13_002496 [Oikeobacillus pervagus]|uniref:DUF4177 domain-containing protein n=1 Tax=Oikeobacillus pervagus TaxID=1325931 RepID=A0AAJ1T0N2_9BACI|nr:DUF4177 domain-containing protein [Oikeobacillus pervagus]MDQ0216074.1 hypothetical protein [Oikeobacillus pervagus]